MPWELIDSEWYKIEFESIGQLQSCPKNRPARKTRVGRRSLHVEWSHTVGSISLISSPLHGGY